MRMLVLAIVGIAVAAAVLSVRALAPEAGQASSHREAPLIAEDPSADTTGRSLLRARTLFQLTVIAN